MADFFDDASEEVAVLMFVFLLALPSILMLCCILEELPLKIDSVFPQSGGDSLDEIPFFCCVWSTTDVFGQACGTLICLFFVVIVLFGFSSLAASVYTVYRGNEAWSAGGSSETSNNLLPILLQGLHHAANSTHISNFATQVLEIAGSTTSASSAGPAMGVLLGQTVAPVMGLHAADAMPAASRHVRRISTSLLSLTSFGAKDGADVGASTRAKNVAAASFPPVSASRKFSGKGKAFLGPAPVKWRAARK